MWMGALLLPAAGILLWHGSRTQTTGRRGQMHSLLASGVIILVATGMFVGVWHATSERRLTSGRAEGDPIILGLDEIAIRSQLFFREYHRWPSQVSELLPNGNPRAIRFLSADGPGEALTHPSRKLQYQPPSTLGMGFVGLPGEAGYFFDEKEVRDQAQKWDGGTRTYSLGKITDPEQMKRLQLDCAEAIRREFSKASIQPPKLGFPPGVASMTVTVPAEQYSLIDTALGDVICKALAPARTSAASQAIPSARVLPPVDEPHPRLQLELLAWLDEVQAGGDWNGWRWNGSVALI